MRNLKILILMILSFWLVFAQNNLTELKLQIDKKIQTKPILLNLYLKDLPAISSKFKNKEIYYQLIDFLKDYKTNKLGLNYSDKYNISKLSYFYLDNYFDKDLVKPDLKLSNTEFDRMFITFIKDGKIRCCQSGKTRTDLDKYISEAVENCINDERFDGKITEDEIKDLTIEMSFLYEPKTITWKNLQIIKNAIEPWIHWLEIKNWKNVAFYKETVQISKNYDTKIALDQLCKKAGLKAWCYLDASTILNIYDTFSFHTNREWNIKNLYRYNFLENLESISKSKIYDRIKLIWQRYQNNINPQTWMVEYLYYPSKDTYEKKENNHIRNLASIRCMGSLDKFLEEKNFQEIIKNSLNYYLKYTKTKDGYSYLEIDWKATIANNAFVILSLLEIDEFDKKDELLKSFANGLLAMQQKDGSYNTDFKWWKNSWVDFYPGESMLALMKLYNCTKDETYLNSVKIAFDYYATYWRENKNTAFIPWHSQVDYLLYIATKDQNIADFVFEMNDWIISNHQTVESIYLDKIWWFTKTSQRISTASYMEWINDAYKLAVLLSDEKHISYYKNSLEQATRFLLQLQYTNENSFYLENPVRSIWGFKQSLLDNQLRNDNSQHAAFALMKIWGNDIFN